MRNQIVTIVFQGIVFVAFLGACLYLYQVYGDEIKSVFVPDESAVLFIDTLALTVTVADDPRERAQGLSNTDSLGELEGKLFIFDSAGYPGMWMKDMRYPIDIIFIGNDLRIVDIAENVTPETYPLTFSPREPARFVLETNAYFVKSFNITRGQTVVIPARYLPADIRIEELQ
jgi:uncharacterized membrane protein (UPF0127 family)